MHAHMNEYYTGRNNRVYLPTEKKLQYDIMQKY